MGILVRSGPLSDPEIQQRIEGHFVPIALDLGGVGRESPFVPAGTPNYAPKTLDRDEIDRFSAIDRQQPLSQGIWIITPDGEVLSSSYHVDPQAMVIEIDLAIEEWQRRSPSPVLPMPADAGMSLLECDPAKSRITFYGRLVDGWNRPPLRDSLDLPIETWGFLPEVVERGAVVALPETIARELASRHYAGEMRLAVRAEEIKQADAAITIEEVVDGRVRGRLQGNIRIDGVVPFTNRRRELDTKLSGELVWLVESRQLQSLRIVSDGHWRSEYPPGVPPSDADVYPGAVYGGALRLSEPLRFLFLMELDNSEKS